ncbi:hypothetical protein GCM10009530_40020 [Microbispora corallina]|uniref:MFS transporter n=1 Tax=Microbispora corallina TaxID=83302 RepID=A0ABQ4G8V6_9ACTN|nr:hypothetical protein [Microbispora corallina]GIH43475.1 hypothetical protein Mco01_64750 [Microbispora corallina]
MLVLVLGPEPGAAGVCWAFATTAAATAAGAVLAWFGLTRRRPDAVPEPAEERA